MWGFSFGGVLTRVNRVGHIFSWLQILILGSWGYLIQDYDLYFQRSRAEQAQKAEAEYRKLLAQRAKDAKEKKKERRRSSLSKSANSVSSN